MYLYGEEYHVVFRFLRGFSNFNHDIWSARQMLSGYHSWGDMGICGVLVGAGWLGLTGFAQCLVSFYST